MSPKFATDKWPFCDRFCPFFAIYMNIFLKTEVQVVKKWPEMVLKWPHFFSFVSNEPLLTFVGTAPVVAVSDPTGIATVQVPSVII